LPWWFGAHRNSQARAKWFGSLVRLAGKASRRARRKGDAHKNDRSFFSTGLDYYDRSCYCQVMNATSTKKIDSESDELRPSKGQVSRATILLAAAKLATTKGLTGLSIGDLAAEVGMSKSGLYAHFKSKDELELATIETASDIFDREVLQPATGTPAGAQRLRALVGSFLAHLERRVFPGGCFFAAVAMELDTRPGLARDRIVEVQDRWLSLLRQCFLDAQAIGEIDSGADVTQAVFETQAMLLAANSLFILANDPARLIQARKGVDHVLARLAVRAEPKKKRSARGKPSSPSGRRETAEKR
jgi:AcrR family transcriptional regulator